MHSLLCTYSDLCPQVSASQTSLELMETNESRKTHPQKTSDLSEDSELREATQSLLPSHSQWLRLPGVRTLHLANTSGRPDT